jgi:hypothetical protein
MGRGSDSAFYRINSNLQTRGYVGQVGGPIGVALRCIIENMGLREIPLAVREPASAKPMARQALAPPDLSPRRRVAVSPFRSELKASYALNNSWSSFTWRRETNSLNDSWLVLFAK